MWSPKDLGEGCTQNKLQRNYSLLFVYTCEFSKFNYTICFFVENTIRGDRRNVQLDRNSRMGNEAKRIWTICYMIQSVLFIVTAESFVYSFIFASGPCKGVGYSNNFPPPLLSLTISLFTSLSSPTTLFHFFFSLLFSNFPLLLFHLFSLNMSKPSEFILYHPNLI